MKRSPFLACLILTISVFTGCEEVEPPLPVAPAGTLTYGTERNEVGSAILALPNGGYLVGGAVETTDSDWDAYLMEIDAAGLKVREQVFADPATRQVIRSIKRSAAGGYLMAGMTEDSEGREFATLMLVDIDLNLTKEHKATFTSPQYYYDTYTSPSYAEAFEMTDGGWMLTASHNSAVGLFRLSATGLTSTQRYVTNDAQRGSVPSREFIQDTDLNMYQFILNGSYSTNGFTFNHLDPNTTFSTLSLSLDLDSIYDYTYAYQFLMGGSVVKPNGNMLATAITVGQYNHLYELNPANGEIAWTKQLNIGEELALMAVGPDNSIHLAGATSTQFGYYPSALNTNMVVAIVDSVGGGLRRRSYGGDAPESVGGIAIGTDGTTAVIGSTQSYGAGGADIFLVLYN